MLSQQDIQNMCKEMGLEYLDEIGKIKELGKWSKLTPEVVNPKIQIFIEKTSITNTEEKGWKYGELGRDIKRNQYFW